MDQRSSVIKFCLATFLDYYERHGWDSVRPDWKQMLNEMDGRTVQAWMVAETRPEYVVGRTGRKRKREERKSRDG